MKTAPNREQFLFLVAGGIILGLILVVVVFNIMGDSSSQKQDAEADVRPVVTLPPQKGGAVEKNGAAAVFTSQGLPTLPEEVPVHVAPDQAIRSDVGSVVPPSSATVVPPPRSEAKVEKKPEAKPEPSKPAVKPEPAKAVAKVEPPPPKAATPTPPKAGAAEGRFAVNMGAFKEESRAVAHKNKLASLGLTVYLQQTTSKGGAVFHRVRLGPYATRAEAGAASRIAKEKSGSEGSIIAYGQ